uniref:Protein kinase domain-containing protein n=1 Tax=Ananas comosus var. bracteatus TaxID=296719 RepID=A0A6V7P0K5_ANACO|nr:unnamed protein product [Ananas comosus var. bracteatus]
MRRPPPPDRVTALSLSSLNLAGAFPPSVANLTFLKRLDLSNNQLDGQVPVELGRLSRLQYLNLSHNSLRGSIPAALGRCSALETIALGYNQLEGEIPPDLANLSSLTYLNPSHNTLSGQIPLSLATDGFSATNLIGMGSYGSVYKGVLEGEGEDSVKVVAVKVLNLQTPGALKSFTAECEAMKNLRHRNLVRIITSCSSSDYNGNEFKALVFEFMPNGSLEDWLHHEASSQAESKHLSLLQRLNIAIDVASALDYLHCHSGTPIVHCDLKPSNVLLDDDMVAHVGDFGLARFRTAQKSASSIGSKDRLDT